jgi:hypothetical protein
MDRKKSELVELQGRTFIIRMLPAAESLAVLKDLLTRTVPLDIFSNIDVGGQSLANLLSGFGGSNKSLMSIDEFAALENRLMKCVSEKFPRDEINVIGEYGEFLVEDLEDNIELYFDLILKVVAFNYKDFFLKKMEALGLIEKIKQEEPTQELIQSLVR